MNGMFSFLLQNVMTTGMLFNELAIMMCSNTNLTLCNYVVTTRTRGTWYSMFGKCWSLDTNLTHGMYKVLKMELEVAR